MSDKTIVAFLTREEIDILAEMRKERREKEFEKILFLQRIEAAYRYSEWLETNEYVSTLMTFRHHFDYAPLDGEDIDMTYKIIMDIRQCVIDGARE